MATKSYGAEEWRPVHIPAFAPFYEVSSEGRVRSLDRIVDDKGFPSRRKGKVLSPGRSRYLNVTLKAEGERRGTKVHILVAFAFLGDPPGPYGRGRGKYTVNHINGDRYDNRATNLEWLTCAANNRHAVETGLVDNRGEGSPVALFTDAEVKGIRERWAADGEPRKGGGLTLTALANEVGTNPDNLRRILTGETWTHAGGPLYVPIRRRSVADIRRIVKDNRGRTVRDAAASEGMHPQALGSRIRKIYECRVSVDDVIHF